MGDKNHSTVNGIFKSSKTWFYGIFLMKKVFFLQVAIVLTCFKFEKSQNKLDLMYKNDQSKKKKNRNIINVKFHFIICRNLNVTVLSKRFPTIII